jgi:transcriptional regulator with XRE-family HTH domain
MSAYEKLKIGNKIRKIRELKGLTREYVADELNISPRSYADIENETVNITLRRLVDIATVFNCELEEILSFTSHKFFNFYVSENKGTNINHTENSVVNELTIIEKIENSKNETIKILENQVAYLQKQLDKK